MAEKVQHPPATPKRAHKATYANDKKKGGYLVRVIGPSAGEFAGREVPVTTRDGTEHMEKLDKLVWSGVDAGMPAKDGKPEMKGTGLPAALYTFVSKPREKIDTEF